jgi:hypothetical protein
MVHVVDASLAGKFRGLVVAPKSVDGLVSC